MKYTINELANSKGVSQPVREALLQMADYKQLYEQVCEQYDVLAKELEAIKQARSAPGQEPVNQRAHGMARRRWAHGKQYALELQERLVKYEGGAPMVLNTTPPAAQPAPVEPLEYWNAVEGWVKIDEVREHFDSVGCGTIYKTAGDGRVPLTAAQRQWVGLTDEMVTAAARALNKRQAEACGVDKNDHWKFYGDDIKEDARAALEAAHNIKERNV